jgi:hypothetical protein
MWNVFIVVTGSEPRKVVEYSPVLSPSFFFAFCPCAEKRRSCGLRLAQWEVTDWQSG